MLIGIQYNQLVISKVMVVTAWSLCFNFFTVSLTVKSFLLTMDKNLCIYGSLVLTGPPTAEPIVGQTLFSKNWCSVVLSERTN